MAGYCSIGSILWALDLRNDRSLSEGISSRIHSTAHRFDLKRHMSHGGCRRPFSPSRKRPRTVRDTCRYPGVRRHTRDSLSTCVSPRSWDRQLRISAAGGPSDSPRQKEPEKPRTSQATEERTRNNPMRIPGTRERERERFWSEIYALSVNCAPRKSLFWGDLYGNFVLCKWSFFGGILLLLICDSWKNLYFVSPVFSVIHVCMKSGSWKFSLLAFVIRVRTLYLGNFPFVICDLYADFENLLPSCTVCWPSTIAWKYFCDLWDFVNLEL